MKVVSSELPNDYKSLDQDREASLADIHDVEEIRILLLQNWMDGRSLWARKANHYEVDKDNCNVTCKAVEKRYYCKTLE